MKPFIIYPDIKNDIKSKGIIVLSGPTGSGKTTLLQQIQTDILREGSILFSKSLAVEKHKVTIHTLISALLFDLSGNDDFRIPRNPEKQIEKLNKLIEINNRKPVVLCVDDAHDIKKETLKGLKGLINQVEKAGSSLCVILAGHPELKTKFSGTNKKNMNMKVYNLEKLVTRKPVERKISPRP